MNCEQMEIEVLLAESGELDVERTAALAAHLAACERCQGYRTDMRRMMEASAGALETRAPGAAVMNAIMDAARARRDRGIFIFAPAVWRPLALAATLALAAGGWWLAVRQSPSNVIHEVTTIVATLSEHEVAMSAAPTDDHALRHLADALLTMEGMTAEELTDADLPGGDVNPPAEPSPTVLRPHSIAAPLARICV